MFTGIIHNLGTVLEVVKQEQMMRLSFGFDHREEKTRSGESIAVNGVCLTAVKINAQAFTADLLPETLRDTNLGQLHVGARVNIERALRKGDSLGGHFVSGHVDGVGRIRRIDKRGRNWRLLVSAPKTIISKLVLKGSVTCDGVSLTVQNISGAGFYVAVIPHTINVTALKYWVLGSLINLETDHSFDLMQNRFYKKKSRKLKIKELIRQGF